MRTLSATANATEKNRLKPIQLNRYLLCNAAAILFLHDADYTSALGIPVYTVHHEHDALMN